jgi:hypothetical protein
MLRGMSISDACELAASVTTAGCWVAAGAAFGSDEDLSPEQAQSWNIIANDAVVAFMELPKK